MITTRQFWNIYTSVLYPITVNLLLWLLTSSICAHGGLQGSAQMGYHGGNAPQRNVMMPGLAAQSAYPGASISQPTPSVMMPGPSVSSMPPVPQGHGFMPVSTPTQQPVAAQEPPSPHSTSGNTSAASFTPAATVQTADTSNVAGA